MKILISANNTNEKKYIIDILLGEFLGLDYNVEIKDVKNYEIILENGNKLIIEDKFFNKFQKDLEYLDEKNIPQKIKFGENEFIVEDDIPIIFGNDKVEVKDNQIICGIDIFGSSFFMLTRWEEYVNKIRDIHNRFPAYASLAYKNNFLDRPVVNEYIEMFWNMLKKLGIKQKRKKIEFELVLTHDVDDVKFWKNKKQLFRIIMSDIIKRKDFLLAIDRIAEYYLIKRKKIKDPYDTFDWLMDKSESIGVKSRFYFMSGGITKYDNRYDIKQQKNLIAKIKKRGHIIGIHSSYNAYNNFEQFKKEKELLEKVCECEIIEGREHYLRFEVPTTWQIWKDNNMEIDSTCGYSDKEGFRCGTGDEFSVFNIFIREKLNLKERPLIFMDDNHYSYNNITFDQSFERVKKLIEYAKKYNMQITLLFHNSIFINDKNIDFKKLNKKLVEIV